MEFFDTILWPIKVAVSWTMVQFHNLLTLTGLDSSSGLTWALSIVGLVVVMRIILIPLFVKQIRASRALQLLAPEMQKIQKKYKGKTDPASREAMSRETMGLYRKHGTNPLASCLPILAQSPIFFALFRVLNSLVPLREGTYANGTEDSIGPLTQELAAEMSQATIFGAPISSWFLSPDATTSVRIVAVVLIIAMSATTFLTQRQLTRKNMPASALQGPMAQQQKIILYLLPLIFAVTGINFPIGVLIYWTTTNLWSMGQQFYVIRRNPTPGSEAEQLLLERKARRAAKKGIPLPVEEEETPEPERPQGQRQQPKRKDRQRPGGAAAKPAPDRPTTPGSKQPGARPKGSGAQGSGKPGGQAGAGKAGSARSGAAKPVGGKPVGSKAGGTTGVGKTAAGKSTAGRTGAAKASAGKASAGQSGRKPAAGGRSTTGNPTSDAARGAQGKGDASGGSGQAGSPARSGTKKKSKDRTQRPGSTDARSGPGDSEQRVRESGPNQGSGDEGPNTQSRDGD